MHVRRLSSRVTTGSVARTVHPKAWPGLRAQRLQAAEPAHRQDDQQWAAACRAIGHYPRVSPVHPRGHRPARRAPHEVKLVLPRGQPLGAAAFSTSTCKSSRADPMCSIFWDPRRDECTICTAVAPNASSPCAHTGTPSHSTDRDQCATSAIANSEPAGHHREVDKGQIVAERPKATTQHLGHANSRYNHSNKHKSCLQYWLRWRFN